MLRFTKKTLLLFAVLALVAAACGSSSDDTTTTAAGPAATTTTAAPTTTTTAAPGDTTTTTAPLPMTPVKTCLVTDLAGVDDRSFNASAWQGVQEAVASGAATTESFVLESDAAEDWQPNIDSMLSQGCEHLVTVGFALGEVTAINATANPGITWTIVDFDFFDFDAFEDVAFDNVRELVFQTDEAAFLAGYLAAGVSETGVMGTYGGAPFPTVSIFMDGFARGAQHYNDVKGTSVRVIGWDVDAQEGSFTGSFTDMGVARSTADSLFDEDVDMIIPVGGAINLPAGDAITERGLDAALIGVDVDAFFAAPDQYQDLWLTSVLKNITKAVNDSVTAHAQGTWTSGLTCGTLANDGVGLSEFHSWDSRVSAELRAEVEALADDIKSGALDASFTFVAEVC
ncbi:MAG: BMP family ABC transporter substrate-binding protein [Acidimicrobiia bacterium]